MINSRNKILLFYATAASTFIAGVLHLAIVPMFPQMPLDITIFFIVSGLAQLFWVIPVIKEWGQDLVLCWDRWNSCLDYYVHSSSTGRRASSSCIRCNNRILSDSFRHTMQYNNCEVRSAN